MEFLYKFISMFRDKVTSLDFLNIVCWFRRCCWFRFSLAYTVVATLYAWLQILRLARRVTFPGVDSCLVYATWVIFSRTFYLISSCIPLIAASIAVSLFRICLVLFIVVSSIVVKLSSNFSCRFRVVFWWFLSFFDHCGICSLVFLAAL